MTTIFSIWPLPSGLPPAAAVGSPASSSAGTATAVRRMDASFVDASTPVVRNRGDVSRPSPMLRRSAGGAGCLTLSEPLALLDEPARLRVQPGHELAELVACPGSVAGQVVAVEHLPHPQDRRDHLVVVQPQVVDTGLGDRHRVAR